MGWERRSCAEILTKFLSSSGIALYEVIETLIAKNFWETLQKLINFKFFQKFGSTVKKHQSDFEDLGDSEEILWLFLGCMM